MYVYTIAVWDAACGYKAEGANWTGGSYCDIICLVIASPVCMYITYHDNIYITNNHDYRPPHPLTPPAYSTTAYTQHVPYCSTFSSPSWKHTLLSTYFLLLSSPFPFLSFPFLSFLLRRFFLSLYLIPFPPCTSNSPHFLLSPPRDPKNAIETCAAARGVGLRVPSWDLLFLFLFFFFSFFLFFSAE